MDTATLAVWDAIAAVIDAGEDPPERLGFPRFYLDREVPDETPVDANGNILSYCLFGQDFEDPSGFVNQPGKASRYVIHCWAWTPRHASRLFAWLTRLLDGKALTLEGHTIAGVIGMSKGGGAADPDGKAYQVPATLLIETLQA